MLLFKAFRPISSRNGVSSASKLARVIQPLRLEPCSTTSTRAIGNPALKPRRNSTTECFTPGNYQQRRAFHCSPNPQEGHRSDGRQYFRHINAHNARPLLTPEQIWAFFTSTKFRGAIVVVAGGLIWFFLANIETVPVSGRRRFNCFSEDSAEKDGELAYKLILSEEMNKGRVLPKSDHRVRRVQMVLKRLIEAGHLGTGQSDRKASKGWEVYVIDDPQRVNAFVLPGGKVFVYSGIFPICKDMNGLAVVLGHEIAHNMAQHYAEKLSTSALLRMAGAALMTLDFSGCTLGLARFLGSIMLDLGITRPSSREQESEADHIGLILMAKACYDPKEAVAFWQRMDGLGSGEIPEWISTHPSNANRLQRITELMPAAEEKYQESGCASLGVHRDAFQDVIGRHFVLRL